MHYLECEYANVTDNRTGEIKFPRDDKFRRLSPCINIITSDCMYNLEILPIVLKGLMSPILHIYGLILRTECTLRI